MLKTLARYAEQLARQGGRLILAGADPQFARQIRKSKLAKRLDADGVFEERDQIFGALDEAYAAAQQWVENARET